MLFVQLSEAGERATESQHAVSKEVEGLEEYGADLEDITDSQLPSSELHNKNVEALRELIVKARSAAEKYGALPGENPKYLGDELARWIHEYYRATQGYAVDKPVSLIVKDGIKEIRSLSEIERELMIGVAKNAKIRPFAVHKKDGVYTVSHGELTVAVFKALNKRKP